MRDPRFETTRRDPVGGARERVLLAKARLRASGRARGAGGPADALGWLCRRPALVGAAAFAVIAAIGPARSARLATRGLRLAALARSLTR